MLMGARARLPDHAGMRLQPFVVTLCGLLIYRGVARCYTERRHRRLRLRPELPDAGMADRRARRLGVPAQHDRLRRRSRLVHGGGAAPLDLRPLPLRRRQERGGGALLRHPHRAHHHRRLCHLLRPDRRWPRSSSPCTRARSRRPRTATSTSSTPSPRRCSAAARCAAARARSSASCSAPILLQVLQNLVNLLGIPSSLNFAVMGGVILIGVLADQQLVRYRRARANVKAAPPSSRPKSSAPPSRGGLRGRPPRKHDRDRSRAGADHHRPVADIRPGAASRRGQLDSILNQTFAPSNFCSSLMARTQRPKSSSARFNDPRIRVVRHDPSKGDRATLAESSVELARGACVRLHGCPTASPIPSGLARQVAFLDAHPDHAAVSAVGWVDWIDERPPPRIKRKPVAADEWPPAACSARASSTSPAWRAPRCCASMRVPGRSRAAPISISGHIAAAAQAEQPAGDPADAPAHQRRRPRSGSAGPRRGAVYGLQLAELGIAFTDDDLDRHCLLRRMRRSASRPTTPTWPGPRPGSATCRRRTRAHAYPEPVFSGCSAPTG